MLTDIKKYLDTVCQQIRFQNAHKLVQKELEDHIIDQTEAFAAEGIAQKEAVKKAIAQMGDPVLVGTQLDRVYRPKTQWHLILFVLFFSIVGIVLQYFLQSIVYEQMPGVKTILSIFIGMGVMILFYHIDFTILADHAVKIYTVYVIAMGVVFFLSAFPVNGYPVYINGVAHVPPLIYLFPVVFTGILYHMRGKCYGGVLLCMASMIPPILFSSNIGINTACVWIILVNILLMTMAIFKNWFAVKKASTLLMLYIPMLFLGGFAAMHPAVRRRLHVAIIDPNNLDYIRYILQNNIKGASLLGRGEAIMLPSGKKLDLLNVLPYSTEFFPACILHYGGWVLLILFLAVYFLFLARIFYLAKKQKSQLGFMTAMSVFLTFSILSIWNIISNSGFFFYFNFLEIPFFSHGGTLYILFFMLFGTLLSVFRTGSCVQDNLITQKTALPFFQFENGTIIIHLFSKKDNAK